MPKINPDSNASAAGMEGIVTHATGKLSELDPSRNVDGTVYEEYESDERPELADGESDPNGPHLFGRDHNDVPAGEARMPDEDTKGVASSPGNSSSASPKNSASTSAKKTSPR